MGSPEHINNLYLPNEDRQVMKSIYRQENLIKYKVFSQIVNEVYIRNM